MLCKKTGLAWGTVSGRYRLYAPQVMNGELVTVDAKFTRPDGKMYNYKRYVPDSAMPHACGHPKTQAPESAAAARAPEAVAQSSYPLDEDRVAAIARIEVKALIDKLAIPAKPRVLIIKSADKPVATAHNPHPRVADLVPYLADRQHVYTWGPAGSGKTYGARQAAELVGLRVAVLMMPGLTPGKLFGFENAKGEVNVTVFADYYRTGGVLIMDEFDGMLPSVGTALNSVLENGAGVFGNNIVARHRDFVVVATGNTDCRGANRAYSGRMPIDLATVARFAFLRWDYDPAHEDSLAYGVLGPQGLLITGWLRKTRELLAAQSVDTVFAGPREGLRIAEDLKRGRALAEAVEAWVWRGITPGVQDRILSVNPLPKVETAQ